jgi:hypothetical protein
MRILKSDYGSDKPIASEFGSVGGYTSLCVIISEIDGRARPELFYL